MSQEIPPEVAKEIADCIFAGRKIDAIRLYREHSGQGLKESKDFVETLEGVLRSREPEKFTARPAGCGCVRVVAACGLGVGCVLAWILSL